MSKLSADSPPPDYKAEELHIENEKGSPVTADLRELAERGHAVTDENGNVLFHFDPVAEKKLLRKIDLWVVPTVALLYLFCFIDRANIGNAKIAGLEKDLKMKGYDYNILLTAFYAPYIFFEIPSNVACKYFGPKIWIPFLCLGFGLMSLATAFVKNFGGAVAVRFLLGVFEAGVLPGIAYYLSRWYRKAELVFRLALYFSMAPLAGGFGGLLASGLVTLKIGSLHGWPSLFLVEGIITMGIAIIAYFTMTDHPSTARWLSPEEKALAIARVKSENVSTTEITEKLDKTKLMRGIVNPNTMAVSWIFLFVNITVQGIAFFTPTIIATIYPNASLIRKQLWTVPPYMVGFAVNLIVPFISWKINKRLPIFIISACLPIIGYIMFLATDTGDGKARYAAVFLIVSGAFPFGCLCNAQAAVNVLSDSARSTAIGWNVMIGNIGGLISTWSFLPHDGPNYPIGNGLNLAGNATILLTSIALLIYLKADNKRRSKVDVHQFLEGKSPKEIQDLDWKNPAFRWHI